MASSRTFLKRSKKLYDSITQLYNYNAFTHLTKNRVKSNTRSMFAIILFDIANFKRINEKYGKSIGDKLLLHIALSMKEVTSKNDILSRICNDTFCICITYRDKNHIISLINALTSKIQTFNIKHNIAPYFGINIIYELSKDIDTYIDEAKIALKYIKGNSLKNYIFFKPTMKEQLLKEEELENEMHELLKNERFKIYLQPKCDLSSSKLIGAEVLVRWDYPGKGTLPPQDFIPFFEKNEFIIKVDEYVWEQACQILNRWIKKGITDLPLSINVSRVHLKTEQAAVHLCDKLVQLTKNYDIPLDLLHLEFTENIYTDNNSIIYKTIQALQSYGFKIAIDDFGSGYSSLNMLMNSSVDIIKIDKNFLLEIENNNRNKAIICGTISMLKQLNVDIITEGIETTEQAEFLLEAGCKIGQGYLYSKPLPIIDFEEQFIKSL